MKINNTFKVHEVVMYCIFTILAIVLLVKIFYVNPRRCVNTVAVDKTTQCYHECCLASYAAEIVSEARNKCLIELCGGQVVCKTRD